MGVWPTAQGHVALMAAGDEIMWVRGDDVRKIIPLTVLVDMVKHASSYQRIHGKGAILHHANTSFVLDWPVAEWVHEAILTGFARH